MVKKLVSGNYTEETVNLDSVTFETEGASISTEVYRSYSFYIIVSNNTGAVTINIEISPDNTNWINLFSKTYTTNSSDTFSYISNFYYMRSTTSSQTNSTVKSIFTGRS